MEEFLERAGLCLYNAVMDVYLLDLNTLRGREEAALPLLSPDRRARALRLRRPGPRRQSIGAGLLLRYVFGPKTPDRTKSGKPFFPGERCFSLSHSGTWAVLATDDLPVGIDVQTFTTPREALVKRVLTPAERQWLTGAGAGGFAFLWSRKEAVLKCLGTGADRPLSSFSVLPEDRPVLDGVAFALHSRETDGYALSAASAGERAVFALRSITAEELMGIEGQ